MGGSLTSDKGTVIGGAYLCMGGRLTSDRGTVIGGGYLVTAGTTTAAGCVVTTGVVPLAPPEVDGSLVCISSSGEAPTLTVAAPMPVVSSTAAYSSGGLVRHGQHILKIFIIVLKLK